MNQVSRFLRRARDGYSHWCPACKEVHCIFDTWKFDGNLEAPTFAPSISITGKQKILNERGEWIGGWHRGQDGVALDHCCHYFLQKGLLVFQGDCTHALSGQTVPLPELPPWLKDSA